MRLSGVPVHVLMFYSSVVAVVIQGGFLARSRRVLPGGRGIFFLALLGFLSLLNTSTFFYAFKATSIANAILTHYIAPVFVALLAPVFLKEPFTKRAAFSIAVATAGLWVLLGMTPSGFLGALKAPGSDALGIAAGAFSGLAYAFIIIVARLIAQGMNPVLLSFSCNLLICLALAPFIKVFPLHALWSFILMGAVHSTLAPVLYFRGIGEVSANRAALLGYVEPIGAIAFGMVFFSEYPAALSIVGGAMILFSGYLTVKAEKMPLGETL